jgi:hypothetical protein
VPSQKGGGARGLLQVKTRSQVAAAEKVDRYFFVLKIHVCCICVLILEGWQVQKESRQGAAHKSSYWYMCPHYVLILVYMCPHGRFKMNRAKARLKAMLEEYGQVLSLLALLVQKYTY